MVAFSLASASPEGKGVMMGIFLLIALFLLGVDGAPAQDGRVIPLDYDWDPANPPLWTMRPEDRERFLENDIFNIGKRDNKIGNFTSIVPLNYTWDPENPPLWTIRPEDRNDSSHANTKASSEHMNAASVEPCSDKTKPATLYYEYKAEDCPPKNKFLSFKAGKMRFDTCGNWDTGGDGRWMYDGCTSFCQLREYRSDEAYCFQVSICLVPTNADSSFLNRNHIRVGSRSSFPEFRLSFSHQMRHD